MRHGAARGGHRRAGCPLPGLGVVGVHRGGVAGFFPAAAGIGLAANDVEHTVETHRRGVVDGGGVGRREPPLFRFDVVLLHGVHALPGGRVAAHDVDLPIEVCHRHFRIGFSQVSPFAPLAHGLRVRCHGDGCRVCGHGTEDGDSTEFRAKALSSLSRHLESPFKSAMQNTATPPLLHGARFPGLGRSRVWRWKQVFRGLAREYVRERRSLTNEPKRNRAKSVHNAPKTILRTRR